MSEDPKVKIYSLDDLVVSPDIIKEAKVFRRARVKEEYEIIIPDEESDILLRDLKTSPFRKQAERLVQLYLESDPKVNYLSQNYYFNEYFNRQYFVLPWLIPIVKDKKLVYKKKYEDELTTFQDSNQLAEIHKNILNYANIENSQVLAEQIHNYQPYTHSPESTTMTNHSGGQVIRIKTPIGEGVEVTRGNLQFRGSYGDWKMTQLIERKKTAKREVITGRNLVDRVVGESLELIGFMQLPISFPSPKLNPDWFASAKIVINPTQLDQVLLDFLPRVNQVIEMYTTNQVTDFRVFLEILEKYGHSVQNLTQSNRKQISEIILTNLENLVPDVYTRADRLEYQYLEKELLGTRGSGILSDEFLKHDALLEYRIKFEDFPHIYHKYMRMIQKLDNGNIWFSLLNPNNKPEDVKRVVKMYNILNLYRDIMSRLQFSYENLLRDTPPNMALFEQLSDNPIDAISDLRPDKRDQIAWFQYFKNGYPDRQEKNYYFRGKWIGCQHEYDSLYQKFEDANDSYPFGKRYTRLTPHNGVVCGFCGDVLIEDTDLVDQGYDQRGQKINTYDNDALLRSTTNIDLFLKKDKSEVVRNGEKLVEQWLDISEKRLTKFQLKALKYELLRVYEDAIVSNKFYQGLQQDPNKIMKKVADRKFGEFFVRDYKIDNPQSFPTSIFLQKLFQFFYSFSAIYEIVIQRLAVYLTVLNWNLVQEDPSFLNPNVLLSSWTPEEIGKVFLGYNLGGKSQMMALKGEDKKRDEDGFYDFFAERASKRYDSSKMSVSEFQKFLKDEYQKYRLKYLYTPNEIGEVFNGANPLEHEIIKIYGEYQKSLGLLDVQEYLNQNFVKYWKIWTGERKVEVKNIEENARISVLAENILLDKDKIRPSNRPLFDRYLAQRKFVLIRQLEQIYVDLVNDNIYNIKTDKAIDGGSAQVVMKKMYLLNKMNCDDWTNVGELGLIGLEEETQRIDLIIKLREEISILEGQIREGGTMDKPYFKFTGGELIRDYRPNPYTIYRTKYVPPDLVERARKKKEKVPYQKIKDVIIDREAAPKVGEKEMPKRSTLFRDLSFLGKIDSLIDNLGDISYLRDLGEFNKHVYQIVNGQMNGVTQCNTIGVVEYPYPKPDEFGKMYTESVNRQYMNSKMQLVNLKKYIISHLRHHIYLMARISDRKQFVMHGLERYMYLFDFEDFNLAFEKFNEEEDDDLGPILSNMEIENLVVQTIPDYGKHMEVSQLLQSIFLTDLVRHLRQVRTRAGRFVRGKKRRRDDEMNAAEIFTEFVRLLLAEVRSLENVNNVHFYHLKINQMFMNKIMWDKMDKAEKKGELEWKILRHNLSVQEFEETIDSTGETPPEDVSQVLEEDEENLDMENEEDDYDESDFTNL